MKKPETDSELTDLIVSTLENSEEFYILGSWENFIRKRRKKRRLVFWFSFTGFAASLLIGWFGFRFILNPEILNSSAELNQKWTDRQYISIYRDNKKAVYDNISDSGIRSKNKKAVLIPDKSPGTDLNFSRTSSVRIPEGNNIIEKKESSDSRMTGNILPPAISKAVIRSGFTLNKSGAPGGLKNTTAAVTPGHKTDTESIHPAGSLTSDHSDSDNLHKKSDSMIPRRLRFGISISPGITSTNTYTSSDFSGGVNADIVLKGRLSLSTGLLVGHQSVVDKATDNPSWMPAGQTEAQLVGIDLPMNLKWKFRIKKSNNYYFSTGISSIAYLSEKYITTSYSQKLVEVVSTVGGEQSVDYRFENVENIEKVTEEPLNSIDFAGRVNIIFGFEQHLSSKVFLHIEPYLKIPVTGLATHDLKYTSSGITCKISF